MHYVWVRKVILVFECYASSHRKAKIRIQKTHHAKRGVRKTKQRVGGNPGGGGGGGGSGGGGGGGYRRVKEGMECKDYIQTAIPNPKP